MKLEQRGRLCDQHHFPSKCLFLSKNLFLDHAAINVKDFELQVYIKTELRKNKINIVYNVL